MFKRIAVSFLPVRWTGPKNSDCFYVNWHIKHSFCFMANQKFCHLLACSLQKYVSWSMNISQEGIICQRSQNIYDFNEIKIWTDNIIWFALYKLPCTLQKCNDFVIYYIKTRGQFLTLRRDYHLKHSGRKYVCILFFSKHFWSSEIFLRLEMSLIWAAVCMHPTTTWISLYLHKSIKIQKLFKLFNILKYGKTNVMVSLKLLERI